MGGLIDRVRAVQRGEAPAPPISKLLGIRITEVEEGKVEMRMAVDKRHANSAGTLHGGMICDLADAAMGTAFATTCTEEESYTTVELKCNFLRPVWKATLTANAWIVYRGKTTGLTECEVRDDKERLIAKLSSTLMVLRGEAAQGRKVDRAEAHASIISEKKP